MWDAVVRGGRCGKGGREKRPKYLTLRYGMDCMVRACSVIEAAGERDRNFGHEMTPARPIPGLAETLSRL